MKIRAYTRPLVSVVAAMIVITTAAVAAASEVHIDMTARMMGSMTLSDGRNVETWGFRLGSGMGGAPHVPGPILQVNQGDHVFIHFRNFSPMDHTIHLHGLDVDQANDGVPQTSFAVPMMGSYTYEFIAPHAGSYNYHCHVDTILHLQMGMYGAINVLPSDGSNHAWDGGPAFDLERTWITAELDMIWNQQQSAADFTVYEPDYFLVNGHDGGAVGADPYTAFGLVGADTALLRLSNMGYLPVRYDFSALWTEVVASDGRPLLQSYNANGLVVAPGERYDVLVRAAAPGVAYVGLEYLDLYDGTVRGIASVPVVASGLPTGVNNSYTGALAISAGSPTPFTGTVSFAITLRDPGSVEVGVFDVRGHRVRQYEMQAETGMVLSWDGHDEDGREVPNGVYHVRFRHGLNVVTRKVMHVR